MSQNEMKKLLEKVHPEITSYDYNNKKVPCIILSEQRYLEIMKKVAGKPISVDTNLNILQDGSGHVFVEVVLIFSLGGITEKIWINANTSLDFFESLAQTSMLALSSPSSDAGKENIFMIQLPKPEKAVNALEIIKKGLLSETNSQN
ncbi:MAG: conserved hypothetical protein [Marine Group I thaumarchaeote]|jgi:hypothetical protein|nr:MAG: conserved hypothetical protein [Marine Group I thaumarchaeote]